MDESRFSADDVLDGRNRVRRDSHNDSRLWNPSHGGRALFTDYSTEGTSPKTTRLALRLLLALAEMTEEEEETVLETLSRRSSWRIGIRRQDERPPYPRVDKLSVHAPCRKLTLPFVNLRFPFRREAPRPYPKVARGDVRL